MDSRIHIRGARSDERDLLKSLMRTASLALEDYRGALLEHPDAIELAEGEIAAGRVRVAVSGAEVAGFIVLLLRDGGEIELDGLFVDPAWWRRGVGTALIAHAIEWGRAQQARAITVVASPTARQFYAENGFDLRGEAETRFGPALAMRLPL
ncbi:GNAT family N-acetyltransferase [Tsuneonella sp. HG249]